MNCPSVHLIPMVDVIMELLREQNTSNSTAFCGDRKVDITATKSVQHIGKLWIGSGLTLSNLSQLFERARLTAFFAVIGYPRG